MLTTQSQSGPRVRVSSWKATVHTSPEVGPAFVYMKPTSLGEDGVGQSQHVA
jgi:hypothetical protein